MKLPAAWVGHSREEESRDLWIQIGIPVFAISILLLALLRGYRIQKYGVDIPYVDEWSQLFDPFTGTVGWNGKLNLAWLWFPWGDHRIVTTKLLIWLLLQYNDWNIITGLWVSYLTYLVIPILVPLASAIDLILGTAHQENSGELLPA